MGRAKANTNIRKKLRRKSIVLIVIIAVLIVALLLPLNMFGSPVGPADEAAETGESPVVQDGAT
jgi:flagellar basal body-associated protein FliL